MQHDTPNEALVALLPDLQRLSRIMARSPENAEDLAQEAALKVWAKLQDGANIDNLRPYLMTALRNEARRPKKVAASLEDADIPSTGPEAPRRMACTEVLKAISTLPEDQATLLHLYVHRGCSYADLAKQTGLPIGTITSRLSRARARLCTHFDVQQGHAVSALLPETGAPSADRTSPD